MLIMNFLLKAKQQLTIMFASSREMFMENSLIGKIDTCTELQFVTFCVQARESSLNVFICVLHKLRYKTVTSAQ